jgi:hypothetical protein
MKRIALFALAAAATVFIAVGAPKIEAQIGISIGVAPACPYGYYDYTPYRCAPYGYYGAEWFNGRTFIGAGPWFHGSNEFRGHVNNNFDVQRGYNGHVPEYGERARGRASYPRRFKGNELRDGRGHTAEERHEGGERR